MVKFLIVCPSPSSLPVNFKVFEKLKFVPIGANPEPEFQVEVAVASILVPKI